MYETRSSTSIEFHTEPNSLSCRQQLYYNVTLLLLLFFASFANFFCSKFAQNTYRPIVFSATMMIVSLTFKLN